MNEFDFIQRLRDQNRSRKHSSRLVTGIGDDASVISQLAGRALVVTTDLLAEGIVVIAAVGQHVARAGGQSGDLAGEGHVRFSFSTPIETIEAGLESLRRNF